VRAIRARCPVELAEVLRAADAGELAFQPEGQDRKLLAHRGRRRGLAVGVGQHRHVAQVARHDGHGVSQGGGPGEPDLLDRALDHAGITEIVDVLAGGAEVDQLGYCRKV